MRVIALKSFTDDAGEFHAYGQEFDEPEGARLDAWIADGAVKADDRVSVPPPKASGKKK